ncbi:MAG TPA: HTH domain-containing protein [bacterium]|nr:HTH domain-containing protein [bacterium]
MGRLPKEIDMEKLLEMAESETPAKEMAQVLGISTPTLKNRIDALRSEQGILLESKSVENLRVIKIKELIITRIENGLANMDNDDLIKSLNVLNKMDAPDRDSGKLQGLLGLLTAIDEEAEVRAEEKFEEKQLEQKTLDITPKSKQFPCL